MKFYPNYVSDRMIRYRNLLNLIKVYMKQYEMIGFFFFQSLYGFMTFHQVGCTINEIKSIDFVSIQSINNELYQILSNLSNHTKIISSRVHCHNFVLLVSYIFIFVSIRKTFERFSFKI